MSSTLLRCANAQNTSSAVMAQRIEPPDIGNPIAHIQPCRKLIMNSALTN